MLWPKPFDDDGRAYSVVSCRVLPSTQLPPIMPAMKIGFPAADLCSKEAHNKKVHIAQRRKHRQSLHSIANAPCSRAGFHTHNQDCSCIRKLLVKSKTPGYDIASKPQREIKELVGSAAAHHCTYVNHGTLQSGRAFRT